MRIKKYKVDEDIEVCTTLAYDHNHCNDVSFNNPDYELVLNNRIELCKLLNTDFDHMVATGQKHTTNFKVVSLEDGGKGIYNQESRIDNTDALITQNSNLWLWVFHADCCPVILYSKDTHTIAAIHSGWKGTVKGISIKVLDYMINELYCNPKQIKAFIGPTINYEDFEAMNDIIKKVKQLPFDTSSFYKRKDQDHYLLDHKGLIKQELLYKGLDIDNIIISNDNTYQDPDFFSYRKRKDTGRNITLVKMK